MLTSFAALVAVALMQTPAPPDSLIARRIDAALRRMATPTGPGVVVLVTRGDTVIYRRARGLADIELGVPMSPDHVFRIASVTKMFTAATVMTLVEQGRMSLDDHLDRYLPAFPNADRVTIRQLLTHTSGVSDVVTNPRPGFSRRDVTTDTLVTEIAKRPLDFMPGSDWRYSNAGFVLLGAALERFTGRPWYDVAQDQVIRPIGLARTVYAGRSELIAGRVTGYSTDAASHRTTEARFLSMTGPAAAGALVSTADDLERWIRALYAGKIVSRSSLALMTAPAPQSRASMRNYQYGFGTYVWHVRSHEMFGHLGQVNGFAATVEYLPSRDLAVILLANDDSFDARTEGRRLAAIALGQPYPDVTAMPMPATTAAALEGTYRFADGDTETLVARDGRLYAQRNGGSAIPLQLTVDEQLHFEPDELSYFQPVRDANGTVTGLDYFPDGEGPSMRLSRARH